MCIYAIVFMYAIQFFAPLVIAEGTFLLKQASV